MGLRVRQVGHFLTLGINELSFLLFVVPVMCKSIFMQVNLGLCFVFIVKE